VERAFFEQNGRFSAKKGVSPAASAASLSPGERLSTARGASPTARGAPLFLDERPSAARGASLFLDERPSAARGASLSPDERSFTASDAPPAARGASLSPDGRSSAAGDAPLSSTERSSRAGEATLSPAERPSAAGDASPAAWETIPPPHRGARAPQPARRFSGPTRIVTDENLLFSRPRPADVFNCDPHIHSGAEGPPPLGPKTFRRSQPEPPPRQWKNRRRLPSGKFGKLTPELSDAGGPTRQHCQLTWPARVRSSDFVRPAIVIIHNH